MSYTETEFSSWIEENKLIVAQFAEHEYIVKGDRQKMSNDYNLYIYRKTKVSELDTQYVYALVKTFEMDHAHGLYVPCNEHVS